MSLRIRPIELAEANAFVARLHRHHKPVVGHRFSLAAWHGIEVVGVAIVGRPVSRHYDPLRVVEVTRLCTDGTPHACSMLYAAAARACRAIGYEIIQTYTLESEPGTSLRAAGWTNAGLSAGGQWSRPGDWSDADQAVLFQRNRTDQPTSAKQRWVKHLSREVSQ